MRRLVLAALGWVAVAAASVPAQAGVTITFNAVPSASNPILTTLTTDGFTFTSGHFHTVDTPGIALFGGGADNGTIYIAEEAGGIGSPITMTPVGGGTFDLTSVDGSRSFLDGSSAAAAGIPNADFLSVVGNQLG